MGGKLIRQTDGTNTLDFFYDESGHPYAVTHSTSEGSNTYYYVTNLQGDVLHIVNGFGTPVVSYSYDPYGKPTISSDTSDVSLGTINPLRYRGYVYDSETGFYYLQSRYYDPTIGRFINADSYASTGQGIIGHNMFTYSLNNPINGCDPCGACFHRWDFWNDCEKCGGETLDKKMAQVSIAWDNTTRHILDVVDTTLYRIRHMDWEQVVEDSFVVAAAEGAAGAVTGFVAGKWGVPFTEGLSLPACALAGGILGALGGFVSEFILSAIREFQSVEVP